MVVHQSMHQASLNSISSHPVSLQGKRIRVRGWLKSFNGPMINATHPEQIEVLGE